MFGIRTCLVVALICALTQLGTLAKAQPSGRSLFSLVRPDATVVVRKHNLGADLVQITMLDPSYPLEGLRAQCESFAKELGQSPRGLYVFKFDLGSTGETNNTNFYVRATFAVDGLTRPEVGEYKLNPIVRAMAAYPPGHPVNGLMIQFENSSPGPDTVKSFGNDMTPVAVEGRYSGPHVGLEYRVAIRTQDPSKIVIPDRTKPEEIPASTIREMEPPYGVLAVVLATSLFVGALVYFFVLHRPPNQVR